MDTIKVVEQMLSNYSWNEIEIENIDLEIEVEKQRDIGASGFEERTGETYKVNNMVQNLVLAKEKKIADLTRRRRELEVENEKVDNALRGLNENERKIIILKYKEHRGESMAWIASKMNVSEAWAAKLKKNAIMKMIRLMHINSYENCYKRSSDKGYKIV